MPTFDDDDPLDWLLFGQLWVFIFGSAMGGIIAIMIVFHGIPQPRFLLSSPMAMIGAIIVMAVGVVCYAKSRRQADD